MEVLNSIISSLIGPNSRLRKLLKSLKSLEKKRKIQIGFSVTASAFFIYHLQLYIRERITARKMKNKGLAKLKARNSKPLPQLNLPDNSRQAYILGLKAFEIVELIDSGALSSDEVLHTYINRAYKLGRRFNSSAEELFEEALSSLKTLPKGLLHGIPISVKDQIHQKGCSSSFGLVHLSESVSPDDSILVALLKNQGGIPFVRGSVMQALMWYECVNNIYGRALNPWDVNRTPGGSSGGDAALVAAGASVIGIGGDLAGSIRIPAAFCGVYGFKPSSRRVSSLGPNQSKPSAHYNLELLYRASIGPIAKCTEDLVLVMRSWNTSEIRKFDTSVPPLAFQEEIYKSTKNLKIGYFDDNQVFPCSGVIKTIIKSVIDGLKDQGHEIIKIRTDSMPRATELFIQAGFSAPSSSFMEVLKGEDTTWAYKKYYYQSKCWLSNYIYQLEMKFKGFYRLAHYLSFSHPISFKQFCEISMELQKIKAEYNEYWASLQLDAVVCPIWPLAPPLHETSVKLSHAFSYALFWNIMDYPAGVVPIRTIREDEENYLECAENDKFVETAKNVMKGSKGLPVAVQVVARTFEDEKVLRVMKTIEEIFKFYSLPNLD